MSEAVLDNASEEVTCVLIPTGERSLLLPNVCVAEVLPWRRTKALGGVPSWCVGVLGWRGQSVVVVDYDALLDDAEQDRAMHRVIVVLNKTQPGEGSAFYAVAAAGLPRLMHLGEDELSREKEADHRAVSLHAMIGSEAAVVPELACLEELVAQII